MTLTDSRQVSNFLATCDIEELRSILDQVGCPMFAIDVDRDGGFRIAAVNVEYERTYVFSHARASGRRLVDLLQPAEF